MSTPHAEKEPQSVLRVRALCKSFAGIVAVDNVDIDIRPGEVRALLGQNGAGKSTLISVIAGVHTPDSGVIELDGVPVEFASPGDALDRGIVAVYQELSLVPELTVAENLYLGLEPVRGRWLRRREMIDGARAILDRLGAQHIDPKASVGDLPIVQQQLVEIGKAMVRDVRLLILDEPSAVLGRSELGLLYDLVDRLRAQDIAIVYITHRLDEVERLADVVTVMRDGQCVVDRSMEGLDRHDLVEAMIGRRLEAFEPTAADRSGEVMLSVNELVLPGAESSPITFDARAGEIVGIAGLTGSGRSRILRTLAGLGSTLDGSITVDGRRVNSGSPRRAMASGIVLVPEDRKRLGLILDQTTQENLTLSVLSDISSAGLQRSGRVASLAESLVERLQIKVAGVHQVVRFLSGGNQQKVVVGRCLATNPKVLLLDEPLRGVDVGAKAEILSIVRSVAAQGATVLAVSSEFEDLIAMTDRVLIMRDGALVEELIGDEVDEGTVLRVAAGAGK